MSINLEKGQNIDLTKGSSIVKFAIGCGWDVNQSSGSAFDLDASVFVLGADGKRISEKHFVFYGNLNSPNDSVVHSGDNLTGAGDGDDEVITVDISKLEADATEIPVIVTIYQADSRRQNFGQVSNAFVRIYNPDSNEEIAKYDLSEDFSTETAVEFGRLYKKDGEWKFKAVGTGEKAGLEEYLRRF